MNRFYLGALSVFYGVFYLVPLDFRPLWAPDETRYAEISREMLATGHWVVPHLLGLRYFEKPVLGYWLNNISQLVFGHSNLAVRFAPALATGIGALLVYWIALRFWQDNRKAFASSLVYLTMLLVYGVGTLSVLDAMFTFWMTAAMAGFCVALDATGYRQRVTGYVLLGLACGAGFLTKGFIAWAVPVVAVVPFMAYRRRLVELLKFGPIAVLAAIVISLPWAFAVQWQAPDYWRYFFWVENIKRFAGTHAQHTAPVWYFVPILILGSLPWLVLACHACWVGVRKRLHHPEFVYLLCWLVLPFLFFSASKGKLATYILPCFAPLALLIGHEVAKLLAARRTRELRANGGVNAAFGLLCIVVLIWFVMTGKWVYNAPYHWGMGLALIAFLGWALCGLLQVYRPLRLWAASALCPLLLGLVSAWALPHNIIDSRVPGPFLEQHDKALANAHALVANRHGVAYMLAWMTRRSDIHLYEERNELAYGLSYPDAPPDKELDAASLPKWLQRQRRAGSVAVVLKYHHTNRQLADYLRPFPSGYRLYHQGDFILLVYSRT